MQVIFDKYILKSTVIFNKKHVVGDDKIDMLVVLHAKTLNSDD